MVLFVLAEAAAAVLTAPVTLSLAAAATSAAVYNAYLANPTPTGTTVQSPKADTSISEVVLRNEKKIENQRYEEMVFEEEREIQTLRSLISQFGPSSYPYEHPLRVLCLDGGGVRGLSSLLIVKQIMQQMAPNVRNPRPCDYFDMISGTSTGGIIAIMLGRLQMSIDECIQAYRDMAKRVFGIETLERLARFGATKARFDAEVLERVIKKYAGNKWMVNYYPNACKVFVVAVKSQNIDGGPKLFRTWGQRAIDEQVRIWEAVRATSAAPTFFKPMNINGVEYSDGGLGYNNPAMLTYLEVVQTYGKGFPIKCFISVGTGASANIKIRDNEGLGTYTIDLLNFLKDLATNTRRAHHEVKELLQFSNNYFRFEVGNDLGSRVGMDRHDLLGVIQSDTEEYLNSRDGRDSLRRAAGAMKAAIRERVPSHLRPMHSTFDNA
ncbi:hypothetical protein AOL_s00054g540 [Orbilia oligospora ATCC 24927]|uniref:PNPLA domain-containing protein n=1 Tax=Arthrobotrys oligospora (strain ATCC 24927 / CBS 115.81 / DSM 1491) TaxID=756982 RepID=G1X6P6_ARTOA|nr:hypothetical protein AOL_s00054g540 [Orbilia oligospora ATCC 24927]EGX51164.1 hypothetical protein AOL_s00054g540 [Orbilia oligospora ATCC 24927]